MKIFISYATSDEIIVRKIANLMPSKIYTWIDHKILDGGSILNNKIKKGINDADIFFLFISNESILSKWVQKEIKWALEKEKKIQYDFIVPVILDMDSWNKWDNELIKEKKFIFNSIDNTYVVSNELKDTILGIILESRNSYIYKKDIINNFFSVFFVLLSLFAFFTTPTKNEHLVYLEKNLQNAIFSDINFNDNYLFSYATYPINRNGGKLLTVGIFGFIVSRKISF